MTGQRPTAGTFITLEGGEGAGKSSQLKRLAAMFRDRGREVVVTREPGGTPGAEAVRRVLLGGAAEPLGPFAEALLFAAARADHVQGVIRPALDRGAVVLADRYLDSSRAYQRAVSLLPHLERVAIDGTMPDLTLILDIDPATGTERVRERDGTLDRFEGDRAEELTARRQVFRDIARQEPVRCVLIDASRDEDAVWAAIEDAVLDRLRPGETLEDVE